MSDAVRVIDQHTELAPASVTPDQHHAQSHVHNGADDSGVVAHAALSGIGANDHHARAHNHSAAGDGTALTPVSVAATGAIAVGSYYAGVEIADPAAPAADNGRLYWRDSGGVTQLVAQFPTGVIIPLATEGIGTPVPTQIVNGSGSVAVSAPGAITLTPTAGQIVAVVGGPLTVNAANAVFASNASLNLPNAAAGSVAIGWDVGGTGFYRAGTNKVGVAANGAAQFRLGDDGFQLVQNALWLGWGTTGGTPDLALYRDAGDTLAQRRGTNPQTQRIYGTYTDGSNYERLRIGAQAAGNYLIAPEAAGTGVVRSIELGATNKIVIGAGGGLGLGGLSNDGWGASLQASGALVMFPGGNQNVRMAGNGNTVYVINASNPGSNSGTVNVQRVDSSSSGVERYGTLFEGQTLTITAGYALQRFHDIRRGTITAASVLTVTDASTVYIENAPLAAGSAVMTRSYALWVDAGDVRIDSAVAMGGGSAPTLGTIGGSGPATAGQNEWLRIVTQNGPRWIPVWA